MSRSEWRTEFVDWLKQQAKTEGDSSRKWKEAGNAPMSDYRAGAANAFLEVIDYLERNP